MEAARINVRYILNENLIRDRETLEREQMLLFFEVASALCPTNDLNEFFNAKKKVKSFFKKLDKGAKKVYKDFNSAQREFFAKLNAKQLDLYEKIATPLKKKFQFLVELALNMGAKLVDVLKAFKAKDGFLYKIFNTVKWSLDKLGKIMSAGKKLLDKTFKAITDFVEKSPKLMKAVKKGQEIGKQVDEFLDKNPWIKKAAGVAVAGLLLWIWCNMAFTGDFDSDFDVSDAIIAAFAGKFSLVDLFLSEAGVQMLFLLAVGMATGGAAGFQWFDVMTNAETAAKLTNATKAGLAVVYSVVKGLVKGSIEKSNQKELLAKGAEPEDVIRQDEAMVRQYIRKILREEYEHRKTFRQYRKVPQVRAV